MVTGSKKYKRGKRPREKADELRDAIWLELLRIGSGRRVSAYTLAWLIDPELCRYSDEGSGAPPRQWFDVDRGKAGVGRARRNRADALIPGSARLYEHPLWALLREVPPKRRDLVKIVRMLPEELAGKLLANPSGSAKYSGHGRVKSPLWRTDVEAVCAYAALDCSLASIYSLDALAALLATYLMLLAENTQDWRLETIGKAAYQLCLAITTDSPFLNFRDEIWDLAEARYFPWERGWTRNIWVLDVSARDRILEASVALGLVRTHPGERRRLLLLATKRFDDRYLAQEAERYTAGIREGEPHPAPSPYLARFVESIHFQSQGAKPSDLQLSSAMAEKLAELEQTRARRRKASPKR